MYYMYHHGKKTYEEIKRYFFKDLDDTLLGFVRSNGRTEGYPEHLLTVFIAFDLTTEYYLDFELDERDYEHFKRLNFSFENWMSVYGLFKQTLKFNHRLNPFISLFYYNLIYSGPFGEDIEGLDMSDELLALMGEELKKLYNLFDKYFISDDSGLIKEIVESAKAVSIPAFVVVHLANWINEHVGDDKKELGDLICELYVTAIEKIFKKPELTDNDYMEISSICFEVDTSNFNENQIDHVYSVIGKYNVDKIRKSIYKRSFIPNPRFRC